MFRMSFKTIETQAELDAIIKSRLDREKESIKAKLADYEQLKAHNAELEQQNAEYKTALEDAKTKASTSEQSIADLQSKVTSYEQAQLRTKIALQNGLPFDLADRLAGSTEEEIKADAEKLAGLMNVSQGLSPLKSTEDPSIGSKDAAYHALVQNLNN